jgi:hypothetical protein
MGMVPTLHVLDAFDLPDVNTKGMGEWKQSWEFLDRLRAQAPAPNVRIRRLALMLRNEFPDDPPTAPIESQNWEDGYAPQPDLCDQSAWSVFSGPYGLERLTPRVINLARELLLDVVDDHFGVYAPARGLPLPQGEGLAFLRAFLQPHTGRRWESSQALAQALSTGLMKVLGTAGFVQMAQTEQTVRFERRVSRGVQSVTAGIYGPEKSLHCRIFIEQRQPGMQGAILDTSLSALRSEQEPAWRQARTGEPFVNLAMTAFWLDWMLEDLGRWGLPLLLRTGRPVAGAPTPTGAGLGLAPAEDAPSLNPDLQQLFRRAKTGDVPALLEAAGHYLAGETVARDPKAAEDLLLQAAGKGSSDAMYNLGVMFSNGDGRPADMKQALAWFAQAADMGHGRSIHMLGRAFRKGIGVAQDVALSNALMVIAHKKGVAEAGAEGIIAGVGAWAKLGESLLEQGGFVRTLEQRLRSPAQPASAAARSGSHRAGSGAAEPTRELPAESMVASPLSPTPTPEVFVDAMTSGVATDMVTLVVNALADALGTQGFRRQGDARLEKRYASGRLGLWVDARPLADGANGVHVYLTATLRDTQRVLKDLLSQGRLKGVEVQAGAPSLMAELMHYHSLTTTGAASAPHDPVTDYCTLIVRRPDEIPARLQQEVLPAIRQVLAEPTPWFLDPPDLMASLKKAVGEAGFPAGLLVMNMEDLILARLCGLPETDSYVDDRTAMARESPGVSRASPDSIRRMTVALKAHVPVDAELSKAFAGHSSVGGSPLARAGWAFFLGPLAGLLAMSAGLPDGVMVTTVLVSLAYVAWQLFRVGGQSGWRFVLPLTVLFPPLALLTIIVLGLRRR